MSFKCSHATLGCYKKALKYPRILRQWEDFGQAKVALKVDSQEELYVLILLFFYLKLSDYTVPSFRPFYRQ